MNALYTKSQPALTDRELVVPSDRQSRMVGVREAARYLNVSASWLNKRRVFSGGPPYVKLGRRVVYFIADLDDFAARNRRRNTSEQIKSE